MTTPTEAESRPPLARHHAIGIDVGTSALKVSVLTNGGLVRTFTSRGYPTNAPASGYAEQDPDDWWHALGEVLDVVFSHYPQITADNTILGLTGQMHTTVLRDETGRVLRPAILWADARAETECRELLAREPSWEEVTGCRPIPAFTSAHLRWLAAHEPETLRRAARLAVPKDDVRQRLGAGWATEPSDASAMNLMDTRTDSWSAPLIAATGASLGLFAPIVASAAITGTVQQLPSNTQTAAFLGVPVIAGAGDQAAQAIALGVRDDGQLGMSVGTSGVAFQAAAAPRPGAFRHALPKTWLALDSTHAAGLAIAWWSRVANLSYHDFPAKIVRPDAPLFLPYLQGGRHGGGAPGTLSDLRATHGAADIASAVMEGVAIELLRLARGVSGGTLGASAIGVGGHAAELPALRSVLAAGFDRPIWSSTRGSAYGAAVLAAQAAGWADLTPESLDGGGEAEAPDPELVEYVAQRIIRYEALLEQLTA
ncbi:MAG TPA: hypothetical protein DEH05_17125 [Propionibacteriaceae bacterium]|nr:hypothetical protein [Propionibacteriaceae bacterium]